MTCPLRVRWLAVAFVALSACGGPDDPAEATGLTEEQFIVTFLALRDADYEATSAEDFQARRDSIFDAHDTSAEELREFVRYWSLDLDRMSATWDTIEARLRRRAEEAQRTGRAMPGV